jgi:hypothetical protein
MCSHCAQVAEICRTHAEEKEEEANLLGISVEELESAVCALENQVSFLQVQKEPRYYVLINLKVASF